mmetsp:Transcript_18645/g.51133  ORF Transcript_18645/g.51133 Transcript_18645/m.51133 type:complete len:353 (-) Transcript_18645:58-1116(-)
MGSTTTRASAGFAASISKLGSILSSSTTTGSTPAGATITASPTVGLATSASNVVPAVPMVTSISDAGSTPVSTSGMAFATVGLVTKRLCDSTLARKFERVVCLVILVGAPAESRDKLKSITAHRTVSSFMAFLSAIRQRAASNCFKLMQSWLADTWLKACSMSASVKRLSVRKHCLQSSANPRLSIPPLEPQNAPNVRLRSSPPDVSPRIARGNSASALATMLASDSSCDNELSDRERLGATGNACVSTLSMFDWPEPSSCTSGSNRSPSRVVDDSCLFLGDVTAAVDVRFGADSLFCWSVRTKPCGVHEAERDSGAARPCEGVRDLTIGRRLCGAGHDGRGATDGGIWIGE